VGHPLKRPRGGQRSSMGRRSPVATTITVSHWSEADGSKGGKLPPLSDAVVRAACQGDCQGLRVMLTQQGPCVLSMRDSIEGWTPALGAARYGHMDVLKFLVDKTEPDRVAELLGTTSTSGVTAAHLAARGGWQDVLVFLVKHVGSAALTARDDDGWLPAHSAARGGHVEVLRFIASETSARETLNDDGVGPRLKSVARKYGQADVLMFVDELSGRVPVRIVSECATQFTSKPPATQFTSKQRPARKYNGEDFLSRLAEAEERDRISPIVPRRVYASPTGVYASPTGSA